MDSFLILIGHTLTQVWHTFTVNWPFIVVSAVVGRFFLSETLYVHIQSPQNVG